ncbi:acyl-CoA dehydrogenase family protein [Serinibacter arcticus]|uniref:acyl-CoA dehydrogenase n=1 Tax=Serinibacter arcticus TaxID=1655435 RepID=UPI0010932198|nr:acyl-CoA dehydrogenase [Serinibacter arcticus]
MSRPAPPRVHLGPSWSGPVERPTLALPPLDVAGALEATRTWTGPEHRVGGGATLALWELLATVAAADLAVARALEPVLDARSILAQAGAGSAAARPALPGDLTPSSTWGVFAAEAPDVTLLAAPSDADGAWHLTGTKPWCSLAAVLEGALVTAHLPDGERGLFAVDLRGPGVAVEAGGWVSRGLAEIPSTPVTFSGARAVAVGAPGWYLARPGFWWGGIGVAACWYGGAVGLARRLHEAARSAPDPSTHRDRLAEALGTLDVRLAEARRTLREGAEAVDHDAAGSPALAPGAGRLLAKRVRAGVAAVAEDALRLTAHALGPAPLTREESHAKRVADLGVYLRQHHPVREAASLGSALVAAEVDPW